MPVKTAEELQKRVLAKQASELEKQSLGQKGDSAPEVQDPNNKGTTAIPKDKDVSQANSNLPAAEPTNIDGGPAGKTLENIDAGVTEAGTGAPQHKTEPSVKAGDTAAKAGDLLTNLKKIAERKKAEKAAMEGGSHSGDAGKGVPETAAVTKPKAPESDPKGPLPASKENAEITGAPKTGSEVAPVKADVQVVMDSDMSEKLAAYANLAHLGAAVVENEENLKIASDILTRQKGADIANALLKEAHQAARGLRVEADKEAQFATILKEASIDDRNRLIAAMQLDVMTSKMSAEDLTKATKLAKLHAHNLSKLANYEDRMAYIAGAKDNAVALDVKQAMVEAGMEQPPELGMEELLALLDNLVTTGAIPAETAAQVAEIILGGEAGAMAGGGEEGLPPPEAGGPEGMPAGPGDEEAEMAALAAESGKIAKNLKKEPAAATA